MGETIEAERRMLTVVEVLTGAATHHLQLCKMAKQHLAAPAGRIADQRIKAPDVSRQQRRQPRAGRTARHGKRSPPRQPDRVRFDLREVSRVSSFVNAIEGSSVR